MSSKLRIIGLILNFVGAFLLSLNSFFKFKVGFGLNEQSVEMKFLKPGEFESDDFYRRQSKFSLFYKTAQKIVQSKQQEQDFELPNEFKELMNNAEKLSNQKLADYRELKETSIQLEEMCRIYLSRSEFSDLEDTMEFVVDKFSELFPNLINEYIFSFPAKIGFSLITIGFFLQLTSEFVND